MNIIRITSLSKKYGEQVALDNLNLSIEEKKIFGLVGTNGAGKTTTINCIAGLLNYKSGKIEIFEKKIAINKIEILNKIGILFENTESLFEYLSGEEQLQFVGKVYGLNKPLLNARIKELLDFFELENFKRKLISEYSKGMRKKLALASILLYNPDFIILDEPFEGLDTLSVIKVKKLLKQLKEKGKTILITSHILSYIEDLADEVAIMHKGKIVFQSETKDIRNKVKNELTKETYNSLEEIFLDLTTGKEEEKTLSWL